MIFCSGARFGDRANFTVWEFVISVGNMELGSDVYAPRIYTLQGSLHAKDRLSVGLVRIDGDVVWGNDCSVGAIFGNGRLSVGNRLLAGSIDFPGDCSVGYGVEVGVGYDRAFDFACLGDVVAQDQLKTGGSVVGGTVSLGWDCHIENDVRSKGDITAKGRAKIGGDVIALGSNVDLGNAKGCAARSYVDGTIKTRTSSAVDIQTFNIWWGCASRSFASTYDLVVEGTVSLYREEYGDVVLKKGARVTIEQRGVSFKSLEIEDDVQIEVTFFGSLIAVGEQKGTPPNDFIVTTKGVY